MPTGQLGEDLYIGGNLSCKTFTPPAGSIDANAIKAAAAIQTSKLDHRSEVTYAQDSTTDATVERRCLHTVKGATGTLIGFSIGAVTKAAGAGNAIVDLLKNGVTVLTAQITLDVNTANYILKDAAGYTSTALLVADVLELQVVSVAATKPKGLFCRLIVDEAAS